MNHNQGTAPFMPLNLALGIIFAGTPLAMGLVSLLYTPFEPNLIIPDAVSAPITATHPLGGDYLGRDTLSRLMTGARITMTMAIMAIATATITAFALSTTAVAARNTTTPSHTAQLTHKTITFITNTLMGIPSLLLALAVVSILGGGIANTTIAITIMLVPGLTRIMQATLIQVYAEDYIKVAKTWGVSNINIALKHALPNATPNIIVAIPIYMSTAILVEAGLSYLGLGVAPPTPSWGIMLNQAIPYINQQPMAAIAPATTIITTILGLNLISDGLNQKLRGKK